MSKEEKAHTVIYKDIPLFLFLIPCINALNYYLTYTNISFSWHTAFTYITDTLMGYAAWWVIRSIIIAMDKKLPYGDKPLKRIVIQLLFTSVAALAVIITSTELLNKIATNTPVPRGFYSFDIFIFLIWFFVINGMYTGWYYYYRLHQSEKLRQEEKKVRQNGFVVKYGKQYLNIAFSEMAGIYVEDDYAVIITNGNKKYLSDQSLDKVEKSVPKELFFRVNRQYILSRHVITGFQRIENGKINIMVSTSGFIPPQITISRLKAAVFIAWFQA